MASTQSNERILVSTRGGHPSTSRCLEVGDGVFEAALHQRRHPIWARMIDKVIVDPPWLPTFRATKHRHCARNKQALQRSPTAAEKAKIETSPAPRQSGSSAVHHGHAGRLRKHLDSLTLTRAKVSRNWPPS